VSFIYLNGISTYCSFIINEHFLSNTYFQQRKKKKTKQNKEHKEKNKQNQKNQKQKQKQKTKTKKEEKHLDYKISSARLKPKINRNDAILRINEI